MAEIRGQRQTAGKEVLRRGSELGSGTAVSSPSVVPGGDPTANAFWTKTHQVVANVV